MTDDPNRNARWARLIAEELRRGGVAHVVLCPGSRNSPLVFALAAVFGADAISHVDERSAGFIALGLIRATGERAAVCVTSGSALANLLPAVTEAAAAELPLFVISADRPWEAHDCGAPQTMPQRGILATFTVAEAALGEPTDDDRALRALRRTVSRLAQTVHGPVHINVPLRDPLPPLPDPTWTPPAVSPEALRGRPGPYTPRHQAGEATPLTPQPWLKPGLRGLIVVGALAEPYTADSAVLALAAATGFPVLADAPTHLRRPTTPNLITTHDALVSGACADAEPELIIQIGPAPLTRAVYEWLDRQHCPWLSFATVASQDSLSRAWLTVEGGWGGAIRQLTTWLAPGDGAWRDRWLTAEAHARSAINTALATAPWSESVAVSTALAQPGFTFVHLASSMAVRHANLLLTPAERPVHSNRGVNGIDGTLGTFLGLSRGEGGPGVLLIGDLAFLHDLPALAGAELGQGAIVLLNNGGGGIFDYLPVAQVPGYQTLIRTSHGRTFASAASLFGLTYHSCRSRAELTAAMAAAATGGLHLVECDLRGLDPVAQHRALITAGNGFPGGIRPA